MLRARSTATLTPYEGSVVSASQCMTKKSQHKLIDRLHSDAKFKQEMQVIYDQVKAEKEMKECTFAPNKGHKKKAGPRHRLVRDPSDKGFGKSKHLAVSLVRREGTETELGAVKASKNDAHNNQNQKAKKKGRNRHVKQQNSLNGNFENKLLLDDVIESAGNNDEDTSEAPNTASKESVKSKHAKKGHKTDELFEYLAYNGVKSQKALELQKLKNQRDLEQCTFKP